MVFALQGFTKEFIAMEGDGVGVEYLGKVIQGDICSRVMLQEKGNFWSMRFKTGNYLLTIRER